MKSTVVASVIALFVGSSLASSLPGDSALRERDTNIAYTITFTWKDNKDPPASFQCDDDQYLLDCAEEAGFEWPYSRRTGTDTAAAARITSGSVDQSDQSFLDDDQIKAGYVLTDVAYPRSDCTLVIGVEDELE